MTDMSRAIRLTLQAHGETLADIPTDILEDFSQITSAFVGDMLSELKRRQAATNDGEDEATTKGTGI